VSETPPSPPSNGSPEPEQRPRFSTEGQKRALGALFLLLSLTFLGIGVAAGTAAVDRPSLVVVATAAIAVAIWLGTLAYRALR
jgi:hypothetical protein